MITSLFILYFTLSVARGLNKKSSSTHFFNDFSKSASPAIEMKIPFVSFSDASPSSTVLYTDVVKERVERSMIQKIEVSYIPETKSFDYFLN